MNDVHFLQSRSPLSPKYSGSIITPTLHALPMVGLREEPSIRYWNSDIFYGWPGYIDSWPFINAI